MVFRFLDLAAGKRNRFLGKFSHECSQFTELRNRVYHFASISNEPTHITRKLWDVDGGRVAEDREALPIPSAALTQVCRQIREEYIKIQRRNADIKIDWHDLPAYFTTFQAPNHDIAPYQLLVNLPHIYSRRPENHAKPIDILPLIMLRLEHPHLTCAFTSPGAAFSYITERRDLNLILWHKSKKWLDSLRNGSIKSIEVHRQGPTFGNIYIWATITHEQEVLGLRRCTLKELGLNEPLRLHFYHIQPISQWCY